MTPTLPLLALLLFLVFRAIARINYNPERAVDRQSVIGFHVPAMLGLASAVLCVASTLTFVWSLVA